MRSDLWVSMYVRLLGKGSLREAYLYQLCSFFKHSADSRLPDTELGAPLVTLSPGGTMPASARPWAGCWVRIIIVIVLMADWVKSLYAIML